MSTFLLLMVGLACLYVGGEALVRGASRLAAALGTAPLIIGLTVVSFGTSAPELAVCVDAVTLGKPSIAIGNIVGSNISNVLLILGTTSIIFSLKVTQQLIRIDVPLMIGISVLFLLLALDRSLSRTDGIVLLAVMTCYIGLLLRLGRRSTSQSAADGATKARRSMAKVWAVNGGWAVVGGVLLAVGGSCLVTGAVGMAERLGVSELVIGLTIVAVGSSLPEIITAIIAAWRGHGDLAIGSVVGSNIANICLVGGVSSAMAPQGIPIPLAVIDFDMPVMIATALSCLPIFAINGRIDRWEGALFVGYFVAYTAYVLLAAADHDALPAFSGIMWTFVFPLTAITFIIVSWQAMRTT